MLINGINKVCLSDNGSIRAFGKKFMIFGENCGENNEEMGHFRAGKIEIFLFSTANKKFIVYSRIPDIVIKFPALRISRFRNIIAYSVSGRYFFCA